jgi:hypothetical protein
MKTPVMAAGLRAEDWTRELQNTEQERYPFQWREWITNLERDGTSFENFGRKIWLNVINMFRAYLKLFIFFFAIGVHC